ncbi:MAG TPA: HPr kinase/phosphatase C-terminal domain-containing protein [Xanthobacteraceae bacterium]|nr:HPr kinase/phosphatase C-terminal domain-containing protein [Xanthobacteraceae bacterium]
MTTIHASAVLVGPRAVLIRGPSGAGKSRLALELIQAAEGGRLTFARLVADDRVMLTGVNGRLLARPAAPLAGLIEVRGLGIRRLPYEPVAMVGLVVDLEAQDACRMAPEVETAALAGVPVPRLAFPGGVLALPVLLAVIGRSGVER